ncbi:MAG: Arc family DNA-binding protein [Acidobacteria bacterium]|nr:Arc family DNA-binding protein [Acidobacteriota bacterium]
MPVSLSIKGVADDLAERLRQRAARHRRSLQGELMAILEESVGVEDRLTPEQALERVRRLGLRTRSESARMIRQDRDAR